jgi:hypothetical protein
MGRAFQSLVFFLCVVCSVAGAYNVLSDNADVERLAQETACGTSAPTAAPDGSASAPKPRAPVSPGAGAPCHPQKTEMERTPLAQTFRFATAKKPLVTVRCARGAVLVGDYTCELR